MNQTITKNHKNTSVLHKLVSNGHYKGVIRPDRFELKRRHFPNNFEIIGTLVENNAFSIESDFTKPIKYFVKAFNILGIMVALSLIFIQSNWIIAVLYFIVRLISHLYVTVKTNKEIELFVGKFFELERTLKN